MIVMTEGQTQGQADQAQEALALLTTCYPGHPWAVRVDGGVMFIRHLENDLKGWGMNIRLCEVDHDAAVLKKKIVMLAGEWLERSGLVRGRAEDAGPTRVEGIPDAQQDWRVRYQRAVEQAMKAAPDTLREEPLRPQEEENDDSEPLARA